MTSVVNSDSTNRMLNQYRMQINVLTNQLDQYKQAIEFLIEDNKKRKSREKEAIEEKEKIINQFRCVVCFSKQKTIVFEPFYISQPVEVVLIKYHIAQSVDVNLNRDYQYLVNKFYYNITYFQLYYLLSSLFLICFCKSSTYSVQLSLLII